jgi:hypothetical protein
MHAEAVISQLATLNKNDLLQVKQLTEVLLGGATLLEPTTTDDNEAMLFHAVRAELTAHGLNGKIPYSRLKDSNYYKSWSQGLTVVNQFIDQHFQSHIKSKIQRIGICRVIIQVLIADLKRLHIPPSLGTIARNLHRVPQAFDNQFPNYIQSGLAYLVIQAMTKK